MTAKIVAVGQFDTRALTWGKHSPAARAGQEEACGFYTCLQKKHHISKADKAACFKSLVEYICIILFGTPITSAPLHSLLLAVSLKITFLVFYSRKPTKDTQSDGIVCCRSGFRDTTSCSQCVTTLYSILQDTLLLQLKFLKFRQKFVLLHRTVVQTKLH